MLLTVFSAYGGIRTSRNTFASVLSRAGLGHLGKGGNALFVAPPLEDCLTGLRALLPKLEQVAVLPTARH